MQTNTFLTSVIEKSGQDILSCYHCQKCTVGCPVAEFMDFHPNVINRMIQYGRRDEVLGSSTIWVCAGCETCGTRCPNGIDIAKIMDALKQMVEQEKVKAKERKIHVMHQVFLSGIRKRGRMHELNLMKDLRLRTGGLFDDLQLGIKMFRLGKLSLFAHKIKNKKELKKMFNQARRMS